MHQPSRPRAHSTRVLALLVGVLALLGTALAPAQATPAGPADGAAATPPTASAQIGCTGFRVVLDNTGSTLPADVVLELTGAPARTVTVDASATREVSGPLAAAPATLTLTSAGQVLATASLADDCLEIGGGVQAGVAAEVKIGCARAVRAELRNHTARAATFLLRLGPRREIELAVAPGRTRLWRGGVGAGRVVRVLHGGEVLVRARAPFVRCR